MEQLRSLWQKAILLCEEETNREEAVAFVRKYEQFSLFDSMDERTLLLTFTGLVVYEKKFHLKYGSTTPASHCYQRLLDKALNGLMNRDFVFDVGDWAAEYSDNGYIPMGNYRGYGPRKFFSFQAELKEKEKAEQFKAKERKEWRIEEGRRKVELAKEKHLERLRTLENLKGLPIEDCIELIALSKKSVYYYYEIIESWFLDNSLNDSQREQVMDLFPKQSTRHNNRLKKRLCNLY